MLNENCHATAVQAVSDLVAIGCAETLFTQGLKIPDDISLVGFGNILTAEYFRVPLTTVRQPKFRLGIAAVDVDDDPAARPARPNQTPVRRTHRTQKHRAATNPSRLKWNRPTQTNPRLSVGKTQNSLPPPRRLHPES